MITGKELPLGQILYVWVSIINKAQFTSVQTSSIKPKHMFRGLQSQLQRSLIFPACGAPARKILFQNSRITYILESHYKTRGKWRRRVPAGNWAAESRKARAVADSGTYDRPNTEEGYDCLWYTHKQITTVFRAMPMHATHSLREQLDGWPCMETEGATDATGMGGMDTPPKEL